MDTSKGQKSRSKLQQFGHIIAGLLILLKSSVVGEHHPVLGKVLLILGVLFILIALLHHQLENKLPLIAERLLFVLESATLFVVAYEMVAEHKHYLQYAYGFAAFMYLLVAILLPRFRRLRAEQSLAAH